MDMKLEAKDLLFLPLKRYNSLHGSSCVGPRVFRTATSAGTHSTSRLYTTLIF